MRALTHQFQNAIFFPPFLVEMIGARMRALTLRYNFTNKSTVASVEMIGARMRALTQYIVKGIDITNKRRNDRSPYEGIDTSNIKNH